MNAKDEFIAHTKLKQVIAAHLYRYLESDDLDTPVLKEYKFDEHLCYEKFLDSLDFDYDAGYGRQELFGVIWYENTWSERYVYDGLEYWIYLKMPNYPLSL